MKELLQKYRWWAVTIPEHIGELFAITIYILFMMSIAGAVISFTSGAYIPGAISLGGAVLVTSLVYLL